MNTHFHLIVQGCFQTYDHKLQIQGEEYEDYPRAVWIPANSAGVIPANAFSSALRLRHVWAEHTLHTVEREAWRYCYQLQIVKLPSTVVSIQHAAFQGCYRLTTVESPGCVEFGVRIFSECCARVMMVRGDSSQASTPARAEQSATYQLTLVSLAGEEIQLPIELQEFDRLCDFENAVLECLPTTGMISTFGRELEFVSLRHKQFLATPSGALCKNAIALV